MSDSGDVQAELDSLAGALAALGVDAGGEQDDEIIRLGGVEAYRAWLAAAMLGAAQRAAMSADSGALSREARQAMWQRQLTAATTTDDRAGRVAALQWQVRTACASLPALARDSRTDPIPLAAAQAAEGLQGLLDFVAATPGAVAAGDVEKLSAHGARLRAARQVLQDAVDNADSLLELLRSVDL